MVRACSRRRDRGRLTLDRPRDLAIGHELHDRYRHVVEAQRVVVERFAVHVHDEGVADGLTGRRSPISIPELSIAT